MISTVTGQRLTNCSSLVVTSQNHYPGQLRLRWKLENDRWMRFRLVGTVWQSDSSDTINCCFHSNACQNTGGGGVRDCQVMKESIKSFCLPDNRVTVRKNKDVNWSTLYKKAQTAKLLLVNAITVNLRKSRWRQENVQTLPDWVDKWKQDNTGNRNIVLYMNWNSQCIFFTEF